MSQTKTADTNRVQTANERQHDSRNTQTDVNALSDHLRDSPMMANLVDALEAKKDIGHYGQFLFATVARHFMEEDEVASLLAGQPDMDEDKARAMVTHVAERNYSPPRRERILEQQKHQQFQILDPEDPDSGNIYRELRFPEATYDHINEYYVEKAESH